VTFWETLPETILKTILKMNFNFNFKDMPLAAGASIRGATNGRDQHHAGKSGIELRVREGKNARESDADRRFEGPKGGIFADNLHQTSWQCLATLSY
jgi:hypothetical protein